MILIFLLHASSHLMMYKILFILLFYYQVINVNDRFITILNEIPYIVLSEEIK